MARHVIVASSAPSAAPDFKGQHYIDDAEPAHYLAVGTSSVNDWQKVGSGGGVNPQDVYDNGDITDPLAVDVANGFAQKATVNTVTNYTIAPAAPPDTSKMWRIYLYIENPMSAFMNIAWTGVTLPTDSFEQQMLTGHGGEMLIELVYISGGWIANLVWTNGSAA